MFESSLGKIGKVRQNIIPDVRDNFERKDAPSSSERIFQTPEEAQPLLERLCPPDVRITLLEATSAFTEGIMYRARVPAGNKERSTQHVHDFVIEKSSDATSFYFIDPEHWVGKRNTLRPPVSNLMVLQLPSDTAQISKAAIARFRTDAIAASDKTILKMSGQLELARDLLQSEALPAPLADHPQEIVFRIVVDSEHAFVQSRYANRWALELFLQGASSAPILEGKIAAQHGVLDRFIKLLQEGAFEPLEDRQA